jgi:hypothetical protein
MTKSNVLLTALLLSTAHLLAEQRRAPIVVDYVPAPTTWEKTTESSEVVAVVQLRARGQHTGSAAGVRGPKALDAYRADVIEVIKNSRSTGIGSELTILRNGGQVNTPSGPVLVEEVGFPAWMPGATLLVFLTWSEPHNAYGLTYGPDSALELAADGRVRTAAKGTLVSSMKGRTHKALLDEVRARVR